MKSKATVFLCCLLPSTVALAEPEGDIHRGEDMIITTSHKLFPNTTIATPSFDIDEKEMLFSKARRLFYLASLNPDAPYYIFTFAAASAKKEGEHLLSAKLWMSYYKNASIDEQREVALVNMKREVIRYAEKIINDNLMQNKTTTLDDMNLPDELMLLPDNSRFILDSLGNPLWIE